LVARELFYLKWLLVGSLLVTVLCDARLGAEKQRERNVELCNVKTVFVAGNSEPENGGRRELQD
jgi:hypothetical protein